MALVTVQRSPSPSTDHDTDSLSEDTTDGKSHLKKRLKTSKQKLRKVISSVRFLTKLRPGLSESYFAYKGAALILPHTECTRKSSKKSHGGEIQNHLQAMLLLLRPEDQIKIAVRLEDVPNSTFKRYICVVVTRGRQDTEEAVILGMDCKPGEALIGLVLPIWLGVTIQLEGDGSFRLSTDEQAYLFNPVSVQAMWSAIQSLVKAVSNAEEMKYLHDGLTHTWVEYYRSKIDRMHVARNHHWNVEGVEFFAPSILTMGDASDESVKWSISNIMKDVMTSVDLEDVTCRDLREAVEEKLGFSVKQHKAFFDEEMIRIFGQLEGPSKILDYLYLGSEWNASNLEELKAIGIGYILNVTKEIDNFFAGTFHYYTVRLADAPESNLLKHWDKTFKFIAKARSHGSKVFVHCKMGISRSASTTMAYLMKENGWGVDEAFNFVKERRNVANPNSGFMEQLQMYEAILSASNKRHYFLTKDQQTSPAEEGMHSEGMMEHDYDCVLGDSMMSAMASDWINAVPSSVSLDEDLEQLHNGSRLVPLGPDMEGTESRSGDSLEESLPDFSAAPLASEKQKIISTDGTQDQVCGGNTSASPGQFKVKPDSFWIKQEEEVDETLSSEGGSVEMNEEHGAEVCNSKQVTIDSTGDQQNLKSSIAECNEENELNPSSLSEISFQDQISSSSCPSLNPQNNVSSPLVSGGSSTSFVPVSMSQISAHDVHSSSNISLPATEQVEILGNDTTTTTISRPTQTHINPLQTNTTIFQKCELGDLQHNSSKDINETPNISQRLPNSFNPTKDAFSSMQTQDGSDTKVAASIPPIVHQGNVESGVRDYFFREKIPWNPGKVQKIREDIDRVGFIGDVDSEDDNKEQMGAFAGDGDGGGRASPQLDHVCNEMAVEGDDRFKMDIDEEKIILDECMEVTSPNKLCDIPTKMEDKDGPFNVETSGALSLYEKEEIPLEPGTVLRTRMEIEERQKCSRTSVGDGDIQTPSSPTKPVLRTSSLKASIKDNQQATSTLLPRRVSCGPVLEKMGHLRKVDMDDAEEDHLMTEEDVNESGIVRAMSEDEDHLMAIAKHSEPHPPSLDTNFKSESYTDPEKVDDASGIVKSYVRKIETHPSIEQKASTAGNEICTENLMFDVTGDIQFKPLSIPPGMNSADVKLDLGFVSGESTTDNQPLLGKTSPERQSETSKGDVTAIVKQLVGQFETKTPLESTAKVSAETDEHLAANARMPFGFETCSLQSGDHEHVAPVETTEHASEKLLSINVQDCVSPQRSSSTGRQQPDSSLLPTSSPPESNISHTADVLSLSLSPLRSTADDAYSGKEERQKGVWNPYQKISPESTVEDISSLRQKFERNSSCEGGGGKQWTCQTQEKNRKLPRPKSVERMCGVFEGKCKSDTSLADERKDYLDATFRQVSEEGRKVRRLHGKSHPLTKLSQGRGVFHSSM